MCNRELQDEEFLVDTFKRGPEKSLLRNSVVSTASQKGFRNFAVPHCSCRFHFVAQ